MGKHMAARPIDMAGVQVAGGRARGAREADNVLAGGGPGAGGTGLRNGSEQYQAEGRALFLGTSGNCQPAVGGPGVPLIEN